MASYPTPNDIIQQGINLKINNNTSIGVALTALHERYLFLKANLKEKENSEHVNRCYIFLRTHGRGNNNFSLHISNEDEEILMSLGYELDTITTYYDSEHTDESGEADIIYFEF